LSPLGCIADDQPPRGETGEPVSLVSDDDKEWHFCKAKGYTFSRCSADV
jgi:hypothetical protein